MFKDGILSFNIVTFWWIAPITFINKDFSCYIQLIGNSLSGLKHSRMIGRSNWFTKAVVVDWYLIIPSGWPIIYDTSPSMNFHVSQNSRCNMLTFFVTIMIILIRDIIGSQYTDAYIPVIIFFLNLNVYLQSVYLIITKTISIFTEIISTNVDTRERISRRNTHNAYLLLLIFTIFHNE